MAVRIIATGAGKTPEAALYAARGAAAKGMGRLMEPVSVRSIERDLCSLDLWTGRPLRPHLVTWYVEAEFE